MASGLLRCVLASILDETPDTSRGKDVKSVATQILDVSTRDETTMRLFDAVSSKLTTAIREVIHKASATCQSLPSLKDKVWREFHQLRQVQLPSIWLSLAQCVACQDNLLDQTVYQKVFESLLREHISSVSKPSSVTRSISLSVDELNALRYASGFVVRQILKKYEKRSDEVADQFVVCLCHLSVEDDVEGDDLLTYTKNWFDRINRGGLFPINDSTFLLLFTEVEKCVQSILPQYMAQKTCKDFKQEVIEKIAGDENVQFNWCLVSQEIVLEKDQQALLQDIVQLWVTVRGFSIVASWMEEYKQLFKKTTQESTGLRKALSGSK